MLAGVEHFYLYDNDSIDNQAEVVKPYIASGLVDYIFAPGKIMQIVAYNDAVKRLKFHCRYMAFIDIDEFIYPKSSQSVVEVVDEILSQAPNAAGLAMHWQCIGKSSARTVKRLQIIHVAFWKDLLGVLRNILQEIPLPKK